jgi:hypothetical protein
MKDSIATPDVCAYEGCPRDKWSKGWCSAHYIQQRKHGVEGMRPLAPREFTRCSVDGCEKVSYAFGACNGHYQQAKKFGWGQLIPLQVINPDKICTFEGCDKIRASGIHCQAHYKMVVKSRPLVDIAAYTAQKGNICIIPGCGGDAHSKGTCALHRNASRFNLTKEKLAELYATNQCSICGDPPIARNLSIDHDHSCCPGQRSCGACVRGLLCNPCNVGIGFLREDIENLKRAIAYLQGDRVFAA